MLNDITTRLSVATIGMFKFYERDIDKSNVANNSLYLFKASLVYL